MTCDPLDVVAVPFPFTERPAVKRRSALAVSSAAFNHTHAQSILAMITSARSTWPSESRYATGARPVSTSRAGFDPSSSRSTTP